MKKILYIIAAALTISAGSAFADDITTSVSVRAHVQPNVEFSVLHQEAQLTITSEDISNGFVNISEAMVISVRTNSKNGYLLSFYADSSQLKGISATTGNNKYDISPSGGEVHMPQEGADYITKKLGFRFDLAEDTVPGTYNWPVAIMVSAM